MLKKMTMGAGKKDGSLTLRRLLVLVQFTVTISVLIGTFVVWHQLHFIRNKNLGFNSENLIYIPAAWSLKPTEFDAFKNELLKHPDIVSVCKSGHVPNYDIRFQTITTWIDAGEKRTGNFRGFMVGYDFQKTFKINLQQGRFFSPEFTADKTDAFVINSAAARYMRMEQPLGQPLEMYGRNGKIIGVVDDFHFASLKEPISPLVFMYDDGARFITIRINSSDWNQIMKFIGEKVKQCIPAIPLTWHFWEDTIEDFYQTEQKLQKLLIAFSVLAFLISGLGLFGLMAFITQRKTREIGIRKVLGATSRSIVYSTTREFIKWILVANAISIPITWYAMNLWLQNFVYRIHLTAWPFLIASVLVFGIAFLTMSWQAFRAAVANPVDALRYE